MNKTMARYRSLRALELWQQGYNFDEIARRLDYANRSGAFKAAHRALEGRTAQVVRDHLVGRLEELDALQDRNWPRAMRGDVAAGLVVLRCIEARLRLYDIN